MAILVGALLLVVPLTVAEAVAASDTYFVEGYVVTPSDTEKNIPLKSVTVMILGSNGQTSSALSDADGYFYVQISGNTNVWINFTLAGYSLKSCPYVGTFKNNEFHTLNLENAPLNEKTNTYTITSKADGYQCALMFPTTSAVSGMVSYQEGVVVGATVELISSSDVTYYRGTTDKSGFYSISCPTGDYKLVVKCNGFVNSNPEQITVTENSVTSNIILEEKKTSAVFGLDVPHAMMLTCIVFGIMVTAAVLFLNRKNGRFNVEDDTAEKDEYEE